MAGRGRAVRAGRRRLAAARSWALVLLAIAMVLAPLRSAGLPALASGAPGALDPTFDLDGIAVNELVSSLSRVDDSARLPDGRVLVLADGLLWRFFADGTVDTGFDEDGVLRPASSDRLRPTELALRPDGSGFVLTSGGGILDPSCPTGRVAVFDAAGAMVTEFGDNGVACIDFPNFGGALISDVAVQADGQIVVLGSRQPPGGASHVALARLSAAGATVDTITQALTSTFENGEELAVQADGNIVVAGSTNTFPDYSTIGVVLSRYLGGTLALDTSFGGGDGVNAESTYLDRSRRPVQLALQPDGLGISVVLAGATLTNDDVDPPVAAIEQLLMDEDGILSDSPVDVELSGHSFVVADDLTATATGYVATGHYQDGAPDNRSGMVGLALGQEYTDATPLVVERPNVDLALAGASSLLLPDGALLVASVLHGPAGAQLLFNRLIEDATADPRSVTLDPTIGTSFGHLGFLTHNATTADRGEAVVAAPDGKVLVGGDTTTSAAGPAGSVGGRGFVLRHNDDGSLDSTFGGPQRPGVAFVDFGVNGVARAPDGRVVAVGSRFFPANGHGAHEYASAQRLLADGSPDPDWNDGKPVHVTAGADLPGTFFRDVAVQPDGKVVAVGDHHGCTGIECTSTNSIVVARFLEGGELDDGFGDGGFALVGEVSGAETALAQGRGIVLEPDGQIVVTGSLASQLVVARLGGDGEPDPAFAAPAGPFGPGVLADDLVPGTEIDRGAGADVALRPDGRIVVAGDLFTVDCANVAACITTTAAVAVQYLSDGKRDGDFGDGGLARVAPVASKGRGVAVDGAGNVVVAGTAAIPVAGDGVLLARLQPGGLPDQGFGANGLVLTTVGQTEAGNAVALTPDGKIVIAGLTGDTRGDKVLTARFEPGSALQCGPSPLSFGSSVLGTGAITQTVTCTNTGPSRVTITGIAASGPNPGDFTPATGQCLTTLVPGQSCAIPVAFAPSAEGARTATLGVEYAGQGESGPVAVGLLGTGVGRNTTLSFDPATLVFGEQLGLSTSPAQTVTVTNIGTLPVTVNGVAVENDGSGDFAVTASTCAGATLQPAASCQVSVTFTPKVPGARAALLRFDHTGAGAPHQLPLAGTGATPTLALNPGLGRPGTVTAVAGTKFPPNQTVSFTWVDPADPLGSGFAEPAFSATAGADGTVAAEVIVFPKSRIGTRSLLGSIGDFSATAPFLVTPGTLQGPEFIHRR